MHRRYPKYGSPSQIQSQKLVPIQDRPNLYLDTAQPWHYLINVTFLAVIRLEMVNSGDAYVKPTADYDEEDANISATTVASTKSFDAAVRTGKSTGLGLETQLIFGNNE